MNSKLLKVSALALSALFLLSTGASAHNPPPNRNTVVTLTLDELDPALSAEVSGSSVPVVIEFYDPQDPDTTGECAQQVPAFQSTQQQFAGKITFVRANTRVQDQNMIARDRIAVCPTHLFVLERKGDTVYAKRIWGYLSEDQLKELFEEFYGVKP